jgi:hypothetical protein
LFHSSAEVVDLSRQALDHRHELPAIVEQPA